MTARELRWLAGALVAAVVLVEVVVFGNDFGFIRGFSQCWWPGPTCHVDWDAWMAVITFLAVLIPARQNMLQQRRNDEREKERQDRDRRTRLLLVEQSLRRFLLDLVKIEAELEAIASRVALVPKILQQHGPVGSAQVLRLQRVIVPRFDGDPDFAQISQACINLETALGTFDALCDAIANINDVESNPAADQQLLNGYMSSMTHSIRNVKHAMEATVPGITSVMP